MPRAVDVRRRVRGLAIFFALSALAVAWPVLARAEPGSPGIKAVVSIKPVHALVARVLEGIATPELLVKGSSSPHSYALKASDARALNSATVFFRVSEQVEPFTGKIVKSLPKSVHVVTLAEAPGVVLLDRRAGITFEDHDHKGEHDHTEHEGGAKDGHVWLDPRNAKAMVEQIVQTLSAASVKDAATLKTNGAKLLAELDALEKEISNTLEPVKGRPFVVFHDAYQYFERRFGLTAAGSITASPDVQPSAKRLTEIRGKIADLSATCVFAEPNVSHSIVSTVTEGTKARSGVLDPEGAMLNEGPGAYVELMRGMASSLRACLNPES